MFLKNIVLFDHLPPAENFINQVLGKKTLKTEKISY